MKIQLIHKYDDIINLKNLLCAWQEFIIGKMFYKVSKNNHRVCWVLKCDIKKFFDSINHEVLLKILGEYVPDQDIMKLLKDVIEGYQTTLSRLCVGTPLLRKEGTATGLPLGNLTSQLFANVYMNILENLMPKVQKFLSEQLKLTLHPDK